MIIMMMRLIDTTTIRTKMIMVDDLNDYVKWNEMRVVMTKIIM
jgi:hypothetical protein